MRLDFADAKNVLLPGKFEVWGELACLPLKFPVLETLIYLEGTTESLSV